MCKTNEENTTTSLYSGSLFNHLKNCINKLVVASKNESKPIFRTFSFLKKDRIVEEMCANELDRLNSFDSNLNVSSIDNLFNNPNYSSETVGRLRALETINGWKYKESSRLR